MRGIWKLAIITSLEGHHYTVCVDSIWNLCTSKEQINEAEADLIATGCLIYICQLINYMLQNLVLDLLLLVGASTLLKPGLDDGNLLGGARPQKLTDLTAAVPSPTSPVDVAVADSILEGVAVDTATQHQVGLDQGAPVQPVPAARNGGVEAGATRFVDLEVLGIKAS